MKALKFAILAGLGIGFATMAACAAVPAPDPAPQISVQAPAPPSPQKPALKPAVTNAVEESYRVDSGDKVKITVYNEPTLTGTFVVDGQGVISMPLIGDVGVKNLTVQELQRLIETKLKGDPDAGVQGYVRNPQVSAEVASYRPFYISGEIGRPGEYAFISGLTVMKAIAAAGDFTYRADKNKIFIKSMDSPDEREVRLTPSTLVRPGDTIRIRERFF
jgi:protein involved in polysaccharide export with SLBB domain